METEAFACAQFFLWKQLMLMHERRHQVADDDQSPTGHQLLLLQKTR